MPDGNDTGAQVGQILLQALTQAAQLRHDAQQFAQQMGAQARRDRMNLATEAFNKGEISRELFSQWTGFPLSAIPEEAPAVVGEKALTKQRGAETTRVQVGTILDIEKERDVTPAQKKLLAVGDPATTMRIAAEAPEASELGRLRAQLDRESRERTGKPVDERVFQGAVSAKFGYHIDPEMAAEAEAFTQESQRLTLRKLRLDADEAQLTYQNLKEGKLTPMQQISVLTELEDPKATLERSEAFAKLQHNVDDRKKLDGLLRKKEASEKAGGKPLTREQNEQLDALQARAPGGRLAAVDPLPTASDLADMNSAMQDQSEYFERIRESVMGRRPEPEEGDEDIVDKATADEPLVDIEFDPDVVIGRILSGEQEPTDEVVSQLAAELDTDEETIRRRVERGRGVGLRREAGEAESKARKEISIRANRKRRLGLPLTPEEQEVIDLQVKRTRFPR